jgi:hypothetical protein
MSPATVVWILIALTLLVIHEHIGRPRKPFANRGWERTNAICDARVLITRLRYQCENLDGIQMLDRIQFRLFDQLQMATDEILAS